MDGICFLFYSLEFCSAFSFSYCCFDYVAYCFRFVPYDNRYFMIYDEEYMKIFNEGYYQGLGNGFCDALLALLLFLIIGITVFVLFRKGKK